MELQDLDGDFEGLVTRSLQQLGHGLCDIPSNYTTWAGAYLSDQELIVSSTR